jgi:hypothetical protein
VRSIWLQVVRRSGSKTEWAFARLTTTCSNEALDEILIRSNAGTRIDCRCVRPPVLHPSDVGPSDLAATAA